MVVTSTNVLDSVNDSIYDRGAEVQAFENSKLGVKGLVDSGVTKVPRMFYSEELAHSETLPTDSKFSVPIIDLQDIHKNSSMRSKVIDKIRSACQEWGFIQLINHGIPVDVLDEMISGIRRFHEQDSEVKKSFFSRDNDKKVRYFSNGSGLFKDQPADWRDSIAFFVSPNPPNPEEIPEVCREIVIEYAKELRKLGCTMFELLSEALGLDPSYLNKFEAANGQCILGHYFPACPEPELTMGASEHTDCDFITIVLQDQTGGLQVLHENQWVDLPPLHGSLVVNIGDLLRLVTNDRFISVDHRVVANHIGPRISIVCFFVNISSQVISKTLGPIKELLSEENPPKYKDTVLQNILSHYPDKGLDGNSPLKPFRL